jgi:prepilin-type N-terminal cleavage/methylation domain-containing protein
LHPGRRNGRARRAYTLIELVIAVTLLGTVMVKLTMVVHEASRAHGRETGSMALEDQARQILDRITYALVGASADTLDPTASFPFFTSGLEYTISFGIQDGEAVWSEPEYIGLVGGTSQLCWGRNIGEANERLVVWCNAVSELVEDEIDNGADDNLNDLTDESGLTFTIRDNSVSIILTLERVDKNGVALQKTVQTMVTPRN